MLLKATVHRTLLVLLAAASCCAGAQSWREVEDVSLEIAEGSALDFSSLVEAGPAGKHGWAKGSKDGRVVFEKNATPQRFFTASISFSPGSGGIPDRKDAKRLVAQLKRTGYNTARLHNVDAMLMSGRDKDFDFSPEQFDRFQYLLAELKAAGIYVVLDVLNLDNGAYGGIYPNRWVIKHALRRDMYFDENARQHWLRLLKDLYARENPHTGISTLKDPAVLALILVNEGGLAELAFREAKGFDKAPPGVYKQPFQAWLKKRYGADLTKLKRAWHHSSKKVDRFEDLELPPSLRGASPAHNDFMRFAAEKEIELFEWMNAQVKALGFGGMTTAFNNWSFQVSDIARSMTSIVDMHGYHTLPEGFVEPGSKVAQSSAIANSARFIRELSSARQWGKPFMVSEYGQPFWNQYRRESIALAPAYAALQDWDLLTNFAENPIIFDYKRQRYQRGQAIYPWGIGADPVLRAGERLAALLYKRGDVASASSRINIYVRPDDIFDQNAGWTQLPEGVTRLTFLTKLGLSFGNAPDTAAANELVISGRAGQFDIVRKLKKAALEMGWADPDGWVATLKDQGIIPKANRSNLGAGLYESSTGQLLMDAKRKLFTVNTAKSAVVSMEAGTSRIGMLTVSSENAAILAAASSLDDKPLPDSRRMLVFLLTDAQNTGMTFTDASRTTLKNFGTFPPQIKTAAVALTLHGRSPHGAKVYPLSLDGSRRPPLSLPKTDAASPKDLHIPIDTETLKGGPTTYFEITFE